MSGTGTVRLHIEPILLKRAYPWVAEHHRHLGRPAGGLFAIAVHDHEDRRRGVIIVGRPAARHYQDGFTVEVSRCCTDGAPNACSMLYGAAWRTARGMGYRRLITYTQSAEPGASLRAAGWRVVAERKPTKGWDRRNRPRADHGADGIARTLWEAS